MKKLLTAVSVFALAGMVASSAQAKIESLAIGGNIDLKGIYGDNLNDATDTAADKNAYYELDFDLDFTGKASDNVEFAIELELDNAGDPMDSGNAAGSGLTVQQAYVTLNEFGNQAVSLTVGQLESAYSLRGNAEITALYDTWIGVQVGLDFEPVSITIFSGNIVEADDLSNTNGTKMDTSINGMNMDYWLSEKNLVTANILKYSAPADVDIMQYVLGVDYFVEENFELFAELGMQKGDSAANVDQDANYYQLGGKYTFTDVQYMPSLELAYKSISGEDTGADTEAWMMLGDHDISILEDEGELEMNGVGNNGLEQFRILVGAQDLGLKGLSLTAGIFLNSQEEKNAATANKDDLGEEYSLRASYAYSEDVEIYGAAALVDYDNQFMGGSDNDMGEYLAWGVKVNF